MAVMAVLLKLHGVYFAVVQAQDLAARYQITAAAVE